MLDNRWSMKTGVAGSITKASHSSMLYISSSDRVVGLKVTDYAIMIAFEVAHGMGINCNEAYYA
jgi:hypothetical protein